jgi:hypothetical protein
MMRAPTRTRRLPRRPTEIRQGPWSPAKISNVTDGGLYLLVAPDNSRPGNAASKQWRMGYRFDRFRILNRLLAAASAGQSISAKGCQLHKKEDWREVPPVLAFARRTATKASAEGRLGHAVATNDA